MGRNQESGNVEKINKYINDERKKENERKKDIKYQ